MKLLTIARVLILASVLPLSFHLHGAELDLTQELKVEVIGKVIEQLENEYILPDRGMVAARELKNRFDSGYFDEISDPRIFGYRITHVLDSIDDWHIWVNYYSNPIREDYVARQPTIEEQQEQAALIRRRNFGFQKVERLVGNVGHIKFSNFYFGRTGFRTGTFECNAVSEKYFRINYRTERRR